MRTLIRVEFSGRLRKIIALISIELPIRSIHIALECTSSNTLFT